MLVFCRILLFACALLFVCSCANNNANNEKDDVHSALDTVAIYKYCMDLAYQWLKLVDNRDAQNSYLIASDVFRESGSMEDWQTAIKSFETIYGKPQKRQFVGINMHDSLPRAPKGLYVTIGFDAAFEKVEHVKERVVLSYNSDFDWNIIGYFPE